MALGKRFLQIAAAKADIIKQTIIQFAQAIGPKTVHEGTRGIGYHGCETGVGSGCMKGDTSLLETGHNDFPRSVKG